MGVEYEAWVVGGELVQKVCAGVQGMVFEEEPGELSLLVGEVCTDPKSRFVARKEQMVIGFREFELPYAA